MEINRKAPATAEGELRIGANPQTVFAVISAIDQWPSWNPDVRSVELVQARSGRAPSSGGGPVPVSSSRPSTWSTRPARNRLDRHDDGHQGRPCVPLPGHRRRLPRPLRGVLGGPAPQPAQGLQPQDPGQGHPQRPGVTSRPRPNTEPPGLSGRDRHDRAAPAPESAATGRPPARPRPVTAGHTCHRGAPDLRRHRVAPAHLVRVRPARRQHQRARRLAATGPPRRQRSCWSGWGRWAWRSPSDASPPVRGGPSSARC